MDISIRGLEEYIKKNQERLIRAAYNSTDNKREKKQNNNRNGKITTVWIFQVTNWQTIIREVQDIVMKYKPLQKNWILSTKAKIDKTQQNCKCRLCDDKDETINHIISERSKLAQKEYKFRYEWVGKVIY